MKTKTLHNCTRYGGTLLLTLFIGLSAAAQKNFLPGIIVFENKDSAHGWIDFKDWERNPKKISFKTSAEAALVVYDISQVGSFEIQKVDVFVKAVVTKDMLPVKLDYLEIEGTEKQVRDTVFLRTLIKGNQLSLYQLVDEKYHYYIQPAGGPYEELLYKVLLRKDAPTLYTTYNIFREQLKRFAAGNEALKSQIDRAKYNDESLKKMVLALNPTAYDVTTGDDGRVKRYKLFAGGGITYNKTSFTGINPDVNMFAPYMYMGYTAGAGVDLFTKRKFHNFFLRLEARYGITRFEGAAVGNGFYTGEKEDRNYKLHGRLISPSATLFYTLLTTNQGKLFLGGGLGFNYSSYQHNTYTRTSQTSGNVKVQNNYLNLGGLWREVLGKVGYTHQNRYEISATTRIYGSFMDHGGIKANAVSTGISLNYGF